MKKIIGIVAAFLALALVLVLGYSLLHQEAKVSSLESIVSDSCIYYLSSDNLEKKIKDFQSSSFMSQVSSAPWHIKYLKPSLDKLSHKVPLFSGFLEKATALALFSVGHSFYKDDIYGDFLFLVEVDSKNQIKLKKYIADFYLSAAAKAKVSHKSYRTVKITSCILRQPSVSVSYTFLSNIILISSKMEIIQKSIDLYKKQANNSLLNNPLFKKAASRIKKDSLIWGFVNNRNYYQGVLSAFGDVQEADPQKSKEAKTALASLESLMKFEDIFEASAFYLDYDDLKEGLAVKTYTFFDRAKDEDHLLDVVANKNPLDKNIAKLIPADVIGYYAGSLDILNGWRFLKKWFLLFDKLAKEQPPAGAHYSQDKGRTLDISFESGLKSFENFLEVNLENDIFSLLGNNLGAALVSISDVDVGVGAPAQPSGSSLAPEGLSFIFPNGYAFFELKDSHKAQNVIDELVKRIITKINQQIKEQQQQELKKVAAAHLEQQEGILPAQQEPPGQEKELLTLQIDNYKGESIKTIDMWEFPIADLKPSYCVLDKYLIFSLTPSLIKKVINAYQRPGPSFSLSPDFEAGKTQDSQQYFYLTSLDVRKLINSLKLSKSFNKLKSLLFASPKSTFSRGDLSSIGNILNNISRVTFSGCLLEPDTIESSFHLEISGL